MKIKLFYEFLTLCLDILILCYHFSLNFWHSKETVGLLNPIFRVEALYFKASELPDHHSILHSHTNQAWKLPKHDPVRGLLAKVAAEVFLQNQAANRKIDDMINMGSDEIETDSDSTYQLINYDFQEQMDKNAGFASDVVSLVMKQLRAGRGPMMGASITVAQREWRI